MADAGAIKETIRKELLRQGDRDMHGAPYVDVFNDQEVLVDGVVDLDALAEAIARSASP